MSNFFRVNIVVPLHSKCLKNLQVGTADEKLRSHSTKELSQRWPLALFFNLLDVVFFMLMLSATIQEIRIFLKGNFYFSQTKCCRTLNASVVRKAFLDLQQLQKSTWRCGASRKIYTSCCAWPNSKTCVRLQNCKIYVLSASLKPACCYIYLKFSKPLLPISVTFNINKIFC